MGAAVYCELVFRVTTYLTLLVALQLYQDGTKVPMFARYPPKFAAGSRRSDLVSNVDLVPAIMDLAGTPYPFFTDGLSILLNDPMPGQVVMTMPWPLVESEGWQS